MFVQIMAFARIIGHVLKTGRDVDVSVKKIMYYIVKTLLYFVKKIVEV